MGSGYAPGIDAIKSSCNSVANTSSYNALKESSQSSKYSFYILNKTRYFLPAVIIVDFLNPVAAKSIFAMYRTDDQAQGISRLVNLNASGIEIHVAEVFAVLSVWELETWCYSMESLGVSISISRIWSENKEEERE